MPRKTPHLNVDNFIKLYNSGKSLKALADQLGCSRVYLTQILRKNNTPIRGRSESMYLRMSQTSPEERSRLSAAAHAAVKGREHTFEEKCKRSITREKRQIGIYPIEKTAKEMLEEKGFVCRAQKAVGPYNVDIALTEHCIAVEIFGGGWHGAGFHARRFNKRIKYLLDSGWLPVIIWVEARSFPFGVGAIDYIVSLVEKIRSDETMRSKEHMIRGDGNISTLGRRNFNKWS